MGRRGRTETFVEVHLDLLPSDRAGYLWLLFSGQRSLEGRLVLQTSWRQSHDYASDLGSRLRDRIYDFVVPRLAIAIAKARDLKKPTAQDLKLTYEMALLVLFRLLFIAYAEDKDLLPYRTNERYRDRSLKKKAREMADLRRRASRPSIVCRLPRFLSSTTAPRTGTKWCGCSASSTPASRRNGACRPTTAACSPKRRPFRRPAPAGRHHACPTRISARCCATCWSIRRHEGSWAGRFPQPGRPRVRHHLRRAAGKRTFGRRGRPGRGQGRPICPGGKKEPKVRKGQIYLHNASGTRKATGSYYTKDFAVEHLLDHALEPAIADHLARLDKLDDRRAAESFFDFRVADIAMGSGHFLVAAVDRIERRFSSYLAKRPLPGVMDELQRLRKAALDGIEQAGGSIDGIEIENVQLLRRQIARRCIYGVDINNIAVQLARLSLWIHTFVPGLPLSFLDHNIVCGNSLVGIATFEEVDDLLTRGGTTPLFSHTADALIGSAEAAVKRLAQLSDADAAEIKEARKAFDEQTKAVADTERMFDILTASRLPEAEISLLPEDFEVDNELFVQGTHRRAMEALGELRPFHFPIAFPEVFLRDRAGFDVILGNPPWEKTQVEEHAFWGAVSAWLARTPATRAGGLQEQLRKTRPDLVKQFEKEVAEAETLQEDAHLRPVPGMGTGDPDLYKAFCWRFWHSDSVGQRPDRRRLATLGALRKGIKRVPEPL